MPWIGVDLDGTLAKMPPDGNIMIIGEPLAPMVNRVKAWLAEDKDVRIFTARVGKTPSEAECRDTIRATFPYAYPWAFRSASSIDVRQWWLNYQEVIISRWCETHLGRRLPITATKDFDMIQLWDDRAVRVMTDTGLTLEEWLQANP